MKKRLLLGTVICSLLVVLFSCSHEIGVGPGTKETVVEAKGSISGTVRYSNAEKDQNGGIMITLDKTDGLNTIAVTKSAACRSIVDSARTVVSSSYTSQDGTYSFSNLEPGTYTVYASSASSKEKAVYTNAVVKADEKTVVDPLNLTATGSISGRVTIDGSDWNTIGFLVFVAGTSYMAMTDNSGCYTISDVPAGTYYQIVATKNNVIHFIDLNVYVSANATANVKTDNFTSSELNNSTQGEKGEDGKGIVWRGSFASEYFIDDPEYLDAFFNTTDGCSYIYTKEGWTLLARAGKDGEKGKDGEDGTNGTSIVWIGERLEVPENPELYWAYYNIETGCSYIWNGYSWSLLAKAGKKGEKGDSGENGISTIWKGELSDAPENPEICWAYYNIESGCSYIWDGYSWNLLSKIGAQGAQGIAGENGISIIWKGECSEAPENPENCWAYYNTETGWSYIYNGTEWEVLAKGGTDGTSIIWKGDLSEAPENPENLWAYYNTEDECSYIYNGSEWELLAKDGKNGTNGKDGIGITWLGSFASSSEITTPSFLNAYYNTTDGCSYIYDGNEWKLLARKGSDGVSGAGGSGNGGIIWLGDFAKESEILNPEVLNAYYNTTTGCSYIYNGTEWKLLAKGGTDGTGITWLGDLPSASYIDNPEYLNAYYNTSDGCSYIYNGREWVLLAKAGINGEPYTDDTSQGTGTLPIVAAFNTGDVLLNDGTVIPYKEGRVFTEEQKKKAVGVMYENEYGIPTGWLGIYNSCGGPKSGDYSWATTEDSRKTSFNDIYCACSTGIEFAENSDFSGDFDGSDNWAYICSVDEEGTKNVARNYPAFNYVNNYASNFNYKGEYAKDWYMPSIAELCYVYRNKTLLNSVINALGGIPLQNTTYWSSSEGTVFKTEFIEGHWADGYPSYTVDFSDGYLNRTERNKRYYVLVVRSIVRDVTPPAATSYVSGSYSRKTKTIRLSWTNPSDKDFSHVIVSYTRDGNKVISDAPNSDGTYIVNNVEPNGQVYDFTVQAVDNAGNKSESRTVRVTVPKGDPEFTSITIPEVNYLKGGEKVTAFITVKNYDSASDIRFTVSCAEKTMIVNDSEITSDYTGLRVPLTIPSKAGEYSITVKWENKSITGIFKVKDFGDCITGSVLLKDGSIIRYDENNLTFTDEQKENAVGVLYCNEYGVPEAWLGIHNTYDGTTSGKYAWARNNTKGYNTYFEEITSTDTDGSDNWNIICDYCPDETSDAEKYFPAFDYVNKYASTFGLTGDYATDWYMPTIAELKTIRNNVTVLNSVLNALNGTVIGNSYWSSSQCDGVGYKNNAWYINIKATNVMENIIKSSSFFDVCVIRAFE